MGIFDKILGGSDNAPEALENLDELIDENEVDAVTPEAKFYVKKVHLRNEGDADLVVNELAAGNIILVDTTPILKQPKRLRMLTEKIKTYITKTNGDIAALTKSHELILATPSGVKIVKARR